MKKKSRSDAAVAGECQRVVRDNGRNSNLFLALVSGSDQLYI